ncbi:MAG: hypothetical protein ACYDH0_08360 [Candidatus Aminicenantales bacterium]
MKKIVLIVGLLAALSPWASGQAVPAKFPVLTGPYLGQKLPGETPEIFAPGIVSTADYNHASVTMSPDGLGVYWACEHKALGHRVIWVSRSIGHRWSEPEVVPFTKEEDGDCPMLSPDGRRLFFLSDRSLESDQGRKRERIWYVDRLPGGWSEPRCVDMTINREHIHWQVAVDKDLNLYFGSERKGSKGNDDVFFSAYLQGRYATPVSLDEAINTPAHESTPFISPDGSYLVFARDGMRISYKDSRGNWTKSQALGPRYGDCCPYVSPDGKYFFFKRSGMDTFRNVYWVEAKIIEDLKPKESSLEMSHEAVGSTSVDSTLRPGVRVSYRPPSPTSGIPLGRFSALPSPVQSAGRMSLASRPGAGEPFVSML